MKKQKVETINMMDLQLNRRKFTTSEIGRGVYIEKPKKGKGSYNRKNKHKKRDNEDYPFFYF